MADTDWGEFISKIAPAVAKGVNSNMAADQTQAISDKAFEQMLANLQARMADYDALGTAGYQDIQAQQLGPSALESIPEDIQGRMAQQEAIAGLDDLSAHGGLSLADLQALNQLQGNLNRNDSARRNALANQYAARGQLGSGAQLAMELQGQQDTAMSANQRGESIAAQAQQRALDAMLKKASLGRGMASDDYARRAAAAQARDAISARNAAARTDAGKYNNSLRGQAYEDKLAQARGKTALTGSINDTLFGSAKSRGNTNMAKAGYRNDLIDQGGQAFGSLASSGGGGSGGSGSTDNGDGSTDEEINFNDDD